MKKIHVFQLLVVFIVLSMVLTACAPKATETTAPEEPAATEAPAETEAPAAEALKVALILPGRADDVSWNQAAYEGMQRAVKNASVPVDLTVVEDVYDPVDIEPALRDYAQQGYDLVVGHGFQFQEPIIKLAPDFPDTNFAIGTGFKLDKNVGVYDTKLEQGGYMMGIIAAYLTESNTVGVIGGLDVSEIHRGHVAYKLGAESVKPDITVLNNFVGDFNDLSGAKEAALGQMKAGADVLWQSGDGIGLAVIGACEEQDIICMGNVANQNDIAPNNVIASFVYDWSAVYSQMIEETVAKNLGDKFYWIEFANDGVSIVFNDNLKDQITPEMQKALDEAKQGFVDGSLDLGDLDAYELK